MAEQTSLQREQIQQLLNQARELVHKDAASGLEFANEAHSLYQSLDHDQEDSLEAEIYLALGKLFVQLANFGKAYKRLNEARALFEKLEDVNKQIDCWHVLSTAHFRFGEPKDSMHTSLRTLELLKRSPNKACFRRL